MANVAVSAERPKHLPSINVATRNGILAITTDVAGWESALAPDEISTVTRVRSTRVNGRNVPIAERRSNGMITWHDTSRNFISTLSEAAGGNRCVDCHG